MTGNWALKHIVLFLEIALLHWFLIKCYLEKTRYNLIRDHVGYKDQMNSVVFLKTSIKAIFLIKGVAVIWGLTTDDFSLCCTNWCLDVCVTSALDIGLVSCTLVLCGFVPYEFTHKVRSIPAEYELLLVSKERTDILSSSYVPSCQDIVACFFSGSCTNWENYDIQLKHQWVNFEDFFCSTACTFLTLLWLRVLGCRSMCVSLDLGGGRKLACV